MTTDSELRNNRRELTKAIAHTYLTFKKEATSEKIANFINHHALIRANIDTGYVANILSRATRGNHSKKRFKNEKGYWRLNV